MDRSVEFENTIEQLADRLDALRRKSEIGLLGNEITLLERQIQELESPYLKAGPERSASRTKRVLPDIPKGRLDPTFNKPPELSLHEIGSPDPLNRDRKLTHRPQTSTPKPDTDPTGPSKFKGNPSAKIKPATFDGTSHWSDYKAHFDACAELNGWNDKEKGLYLAVSLRGQAQGVFGNLASKSSNYEELANALQERFAPPNQTELYRVQLKERRQRATEALTELGQDIWRLTNLAYPRAPSDVRETLAKEQFIDSLHSSDMRLRIKQARPTSLNQAVRHAVELEAFNKAEKRHEEQGYMRQANQQEAVSADKHDSDWNFLKDTMKSIQKSLETLTKQNRYQHKSDGFQSNLKAGGTSQRDKTVPQRFKRKCYDCGSETHVKRNCPKNKEKKEAETKGQQHTKQVSSSGAGLFADCKVNNIPTQCLIDTGATLTIMSFGMWESIAPCSSPTLEPYEGCVFTASGDRIEIKGKTSVFVELDSIHCPCNILVANIDLDLILGLDFLKKHNCQIDVANNSLKVQDKTCPLNMTGKIGCYRVTISNTVEIPPRSEIITEGTVHMPVIRKQNVTIVEPIDQSYITGKGIVAKALVHTNDKIPLRLLNPSEETKRLYTGTHVANVSPVSKVYDTVKTDMLEISSTCVPKHLSELYERSVDGLTPEQCKQIARLLCKHVSTFSKSDEDLGRTGIIRHQIPTTETRPIKQPLRRMPIGMKQEADKQIDKMLKKDVIQPSVSPWASAIVMVKKKDGSTRFCVDYRKLNDITVKDAYPLPRIDDSLDQLSGAEWFSCLDLNSGYWQVEVEERDRIKTAFVSRRGLFEFKVMPFGLCNAPATFERLMETVLAGLNWRICLIYLDDIIVIGRTFEDMIKNLDQVLQKLHDAGLKLKPRKCQLFAKQVEFLGHVISNCGIQTDPKKTNVVRDWPQPTKLHDVRSFIGFCSYYRRFIPKFAELAKPLHKLTEKGQKFVWTNECNIAFEKLKSKMVESPILAHPDFSKPFILDTDASDQAIGAVLSQNINGHERVIAYASRTLSRPERRYCVTRKELLALVHFVKYFRHYLYGKSFTVRTDHGSLRWLMQFKNPEGQIARWLEILSSYDMKIEHRAGKSHKNADGLSRIPCNQCGKESTSQAETSSSRINRIAEDENVELKEIKVLQEEDDEILLVKSWIKAGERPEHSKIADGSYFLKSLWSQWPRLELKNDIVVRKWDVLGTDIVLWQAVIPMGYRREVLRYAHDIKASGHLGVKKTLSKIRQKYYWPGLQNDVRTYIAGCEKCCKRKEPIPSKKAPMQIIRSGYPMERIAIDIAGEFPVTERGNKYILVIQDYYTKWVECFAMHNMESATVAKLLVNEVVSRFGVPNKIHSDQGRQFESLLFKEMCQLLQIEKTRTTAYHPQSDGMVERFNRTLASMVGVFVNEHHSDWDELLPYLTMAYRSTEHETTGMSPNLLMLGRETTTPLDLAFEMPPAIKTIPRNQWVWELQERLESAYRLVREQTGKAMYRQKRYHDRKLSFDKVDEGESVYVLFPVRKAGCSRKWTCFWRGPFKINKKFSDVLFQVDCGRFGENQIIHIDRIRKAVGQTLAGEDGEQSHLVSGGDVLPSESNIFDDDDAVEEDKRPRRVTRKPAWLDDYVFSAFREKMPQTKITPRKQLKPGFICSTCKEKFSTQEEFKDHVLECATKRYRCDVCDSTFKKLAYKNQHMKRYHKQEKIEQKEEHGEKDYSDSEKESSKADDSDSENSDWDREPVDIILGDEESKHDSDSGSVKLETAEDEMDRRKINDIREGRMIRKRTHPDPVIAPVKKSVKTVVQLNERTVHNKQEESSGEESQAKVMCSSGNTSKGGKDSSQRSAGMESQKQRLKLQFSVEQGKDIRSRQSFSLSIDEEEVVSSSVVIQANRGLGTMDFSLGDFVSSQSVKPENINIKVDKGKLVMTINTE